MQETRFMENEYSVNLPTKFVYQGKEWDGWINVVNVFRASIVLGTPGSGRTNRGTHRRSTLIVTRFPNVDGRNII
jgi:hypothetical protein